MRFRAFGDSSLEFELLCWAKTPADRGRVTHELNLAIFGEFQKKEHQHPLSTAGRLHAPREDVFG